MNAISQKLLRRFIVLAGDRLEGKWVLIGGTLLPLLGRGYRATVDIDFIGLGEAGAHQTLRLMELAETLGLPIEAINQAGAFFLTRIPGFEDHLIPLRTGKMATIYRPDLVLYLQLKLGRLSESDLNDCREYIRLTRKLKDPDLSKQARTVLRGALKSATGTDRRSRIESLLETLELSR